jgi:uncharacterized protein YeaO (DUF488 family)
MFSVLTKRIYDKPSDKDGYRVLVDRLWPRGVSKDEAKLDEWAKEIAPSNELRKSFDHKPEKMPEFKEKYLYEIEANEVATEFENIILKELNKHNVTLLYGAKDEEHNNAIVLREWIEKKREEK